MAGRKTGRTDGEGSNAARQADEDRGGPRHARQLRQPDLFRDTKLSGFAVRVTAAGKKAFIIEYRQAGRNRRVTLGKYPPLTIDKARKLAQEKLGDVAAGEDTAEQRRQERQGDTLADVATRYLDDLKARAEAGARRGRLSGWQGALQLWNKHVPAAMKRRKVADVSTEDVRRIHKALGDAGMAPTADHVKTVLHAIFEHAITEGLIPSNPAAAIKRYSKPAKRRRALSLDELAALGKVLDGVEASGTVTVTDDAGNETSYDVDPAAALTLRLLALTGMRKSELLGHHTKARRGPREGLRWADADLDAGRYTLEAVGTRT